MEVRHSIIKKATVRVFIDDRPSGSGFIISTNGLIATCFHVVQKLSPTSDGNTQVTYSSSIVVEFEDGQRLPANIHHSCQNENLVRSISKDFCILQVDAQNLVPLELGEFNDIEEGANIYLCGFPLGIDQPVVSVGILTTKWSSPGYLNQGTNRDVAWLDITMNSGNSGGPIMLMGDNPESDKVIGIATFGLNPFAKSSKELVKLVQTFPGNAVIMGVDFRKFATLIGTALASNSTGVNGCVSIEYLNSIER